MTGEFIDEKTKKAREIIVQNLISKGNKSKKIITNEIKSIDVDRLIVQFKNQSQDQIINNIEPVNNKLEYILRTLSIDSIATLLMSVNNNPQKSHPPPKKPPNPPPPAPTTTASNTTRAPTTTTSQARSPPKRHRHRLCKRCRHHQPHSNHHYLSGSVSPLACWSFAQYRLL